MREAMRPLDVVFFAERWDASWRRSQQFAWRLSGLAEVRQVFFIEFPLSWTSRVKKALNRADEDAKERWRRVEERGFTWFYEKIRVVTPVAPLPFFRGGFWRGWNEELAVASALWPVRTFLREKHAAGRLLLWMTSPVWARACGRLPEDYFVYEYFGNISGLYTEKEMARVVGGVEEDLIRRATLAIAQTPDHLGKLRALRLGSPSALIPNGAVIAEGAAPVPLPPSGGAPLIGYIGGINRRLDLDLLEGLVRSERSWQFLFIGDQDGLPRTRALLSEPNVRYLGRMAHEEALSVLGECHACIIPYRSLELLASPIKLYDYLSVGRPVVSVSWSGLEGLEEFVATATDAEGFRRELRRVISEDTPELRRRRMDAARRNSWEGRFQELCRLLEASGVLPAASR